MNALRRLNPAVIAACAALFACSNEPSGPAGGASTTARPATAEAGSGAIDTTAAPTGPAESAESAELATTAPAAPAFEQMARARPVGKISVPVDVRYQVAGVIGKNQPATVQLAFVPRVAGTNLRVEFPDTPGLAVEDGDGSSWPQKASTTEVFRKEVVVTPTEGGAPVMRAMVSMDVGESRFISMFTIPLAEQPLPSKGKRPLQR